MTTRYIDATPTWQATANMLAVLFENGTPEGKETARRELARMAALADAMVDTAAAFNAPATDEGDKLARMYATMREHGVVA